MTKKAASKSNGVSARSPFTPEISKKLDEREIALAKGEGVEIADLEELRRMIGSRKPTPKHS